MREGEREGGREGGGGGGGERGHHWGYRATCMYGRISLHYNYLSTGSADIMKLNPRALDVISLPTE